jgi:hypothetical protein
VLPVVLRDTWTVAAGAPLPLSLAVCNDASAVPGAELALALGSEAGQVASLDLAAASVTELELPPARAPERPGDHELTVSLSGAAVAAVNRYRVHVVEAPTLAGTRVRVIGRRAVKAALRLLGAELAPMDEGGTPVVVGERLLGRPAGKQLARFLAAGERVVVLAQLPTAAGKLPVPATGAALATAWGSTPFLFTTDAVTGAVLPRRRVLTTELLSVSPTSAWTSLAGRTWAGTTYVGVFKPYPGRLAGTVLGSVHVDAGTLWLCQLPLCAAVNAGDAAAAAILAAIVRGKL